MTLRSLIEARCLELGMTRGEFVRRAGYQNITKALLPTDDISEDLSVQPAPSPLVQRIAHGLRLPLEEVVVAIADSRRKLEAPYPAAFEPRAFPIYRAPSPPRGGTVAGGPPQEIRFVPDSHPDTYIGQCLAYMQGREFPGLELESFVVNYGPDHAIRYGALGDEIEHLPRAYDPVRDNLEDLR